MATHDDFEEQIITTLKFEGGYVDDPNDAGGKTNFGISQRSYPDVDIENLTREAAISIYYQHYWLPLRPEQLPRLVAMKLFDLSVNMGHFAAVRVLQTACNTFANNNKLVVDGILGPRTYAAANTPNPGPLMTAIRIAAAEHYTQLAQAYPDNNKYLRGWLRRANA